MKKLFIVIAILFSVSVKAQFDINTYKDTISVWLPNDTIAGIPLLRKAVYQTLIDNREYQTVSISGYIRYFTEDSILFSLIPKKPFELIASRDSYVLLPDGDIVGDINDVRNKYGLLDTATNQWTYSTPYLITEQEFYLMASSQPISVRQLILAAMQRSTSLKLKK